MTGWSSSHILLYVCVWKNCTYVYPVSWSSWISRFSWKTTVTLQKNGIKYLLSVQLVSPVFSNFHCTGTFTFGPGGPWMPGCPCIHLQDGPPAVRPISAYPPHCHGQKGETKVAHLSLTEGVKLCWTWVNSPHQRARSSPLNKPALGHMIHPSAGGPPGERQEIIWQIKVVNQIKRS